MMFQDTLNLILQSLATLYIGAIWLRLLMQWSRVDFYNPLVQSIVKLTSPVITPLRRVIPSIGSLDTASVVAAFLLTLVLGVLAALIIGYPIVIGSQLLGAALGSILLLIKVSWWIVLIGVILSWFPSAAHHPVGGVIMHISRGLLEPLRKIMPDLGMIDLSPILGLLGLTVLESVLYTLMSSAQLPALYGWVM